MRQCCVAYLHVCMYGLADRIGASSAHGLLHLASRLRPTETPGWFLQPGPQGQRLADKCALGAAQLSRTLAGRGSAFDSSHSAQNIIGAAGAAANGDGCSSPWLLLAPGDPPREPADAPADAPGRGSERPRGEGPAVCGAGGASGAGSPPPGTMLASDVSLPMVCSGRLKRLGVPGRALSSKLIGPSSRLRALSLSRLATVSGRMSMRTVPGMVAQSTRREVPQT